MNELLPASRTNSDPGNATGSLDFNCLSVPKMDLFDAVEELPEKEKLLLALHYYEGLSFKEIGDLLGIAEQEAIMLHAGALAKLQTLIQEKS